MPKATKSPAKKKKTPTLMEFYGAECPHCHAMDSLVKKLEKDLKVKLAKYEVWHDEKNAKLMKSFDKDRCGGVPFFYNAKTKEFLCGEGDYATLKAWATK